MKNAMRFFKENFYTPSYGFPLSILRIVVGLALIAEGMAVFPYLSALYGPLGYLQSHLMDTLTGPTFPGLSTAIGIPTESYERFFQIFYTGHIVIALMFVLGFKTRFSSIAIWLTQTVLINSGHLSSYGVDRYLQNLVFMMMWMPISNGLSLDNYLDQKKAVPKPSCTLSLRLLQLFILATYVNAGLAKTLGMDWWTGNAIWEVLHMPGFNHFNFYWLAEYPFLAKLLSWGTLFIETFYIVGVLFNRLRKPWALAIIALHLGIAATMGLVLFGMTLAAVNAALFLTRERADIFYDTQVIKRKMWTPFRA